MERIQFDQLLLLYRNTEFAPGSREGVVTVSGPAVCEILMRLETDEQASRDAGISLLTDASACKVGDKVKVEVGSPRSGIGVLADTFDDLLRSPDACFEEPRNYFVIEDRIERDSRPPHQFQTRYRQALAVVAIIGESATFVDRTRREMIFVGDSKLAVPASFGSDLLVKIDVGQTAKLVDLFRDLSHRDQKLAILSASVVRLVQSVKREERLAQLLTNIDTIVDDVGNGYRLFASSFSYSKIRSELAAAKIEFTTRVHKTIVDIQGQLLGIPAATIIVATQLKEPTSCLTSWANFAVISGMWAFAVLVILSIVNQWLTLSTIGAEIKRQKAKLQKDYAELGSELTSAFNGLGCRVNWHRAALIIVAIAACCGALVATFAYSGLTSSVNFCT